MHPPAVAVSRLLMGAGMGLLLGVGFAMQDQRSSLSSINAIHGFAIVGLICLVLGWQLSNGKGPLASQFSNESDEVMAARVRDDIEDVQRSEEVTNAWAELEAKVLTSELNEEE
jgi:xanthosine utilization system XapX-like protein